jgi:hypothetical protein
VGKNYFVTQWPALFMVSQEGKVIHAAQGFGIDHAQKALENVRKVLGELSTEPLSPGLGQWMLAHGLDPASKPVSAAAEAASSAAKPAPVAPKKVVKKKHR